MKYFSLDEFKCSHSGENQIVPEFVEKLDHLREECGFPFVITSGYRCHWHPVEMKKERPGMHTKGIAADIKISNGFQRYLLIKKALEHGFTGIGVAKTFIHLDTRMDTPVIWTYS